MGLKVDPAVLAKEAENFGRIAGELKTVMSHVEMIGNQLKANLDSPAAGVAAQAALGRFHEAASKVNQELDEISMNLHTSVGQYGTSDDDHGSNLSATMNINH
ncbi:type VII secretion protein EsxB [Mycolicibacterium setense]|uniref:WXG100 family type VII secretion target n=1 Tax=Mycolicibacterium setense TaxID=431269 RepID=UPI0007E98BDE|nr:WXG100 family type VII secretion target [Mycolicibacterium setense]OBB13771.1 type VII secretion protein EsxB [Mycolicibacterium setense]